MKRKIKCLLLSGLLLFGQPVVGVMANNLSPIQSVGESTDLEDATNRNADDAREVVDDSAFGDFSDLELDPNNPQSLVKALKQEIKHSTTNTQFVNGLADVENPEVNFYTVLNDGDNHYLTHSVPNYLPKNSLINGNQDGQVLAGYLPAADYLVAGVAELLDTAPEIAEETNLEEFYEYAQENIDELEALFIKDTNLTYNEKNLEFINALNTALLETVDNWLEVTELAPANLEDLIDEDVEMEIHDDVIGYVLEGEEATSFLGILQDQQKDYQELDSVVELFDKEADGMIILDFESGELAVALGQKKGVLEHYIRLESYQLLFPEEEQVMTVDEFQDHVGISVLDTLNGLGLLLDE